VVLLALGIVSAVFAWNLGWHGWAAYLSLGNVVVNLYPILLQRYTRSRQAPTGRPPYTERKRGLRAPCGADETLGKGLIMRNVRYGVAMSLDGFIAGLNGEYDWIVHDPDIISLEYDVARG
jgi:hypothetical protein